MDRISDALEIFTFPVRRELARGNVISFAEEEGII
jgi:hypothetical protein